MIRMSKRSFRDVLTTSSLAFATLAALHLTIGSTPARAASEGCSHGYCSSSTSCSSGANHDCCFSGAECTSISCILSPQGC
jgi:hypothetical protein